MDDPVRVASPTPASRIQPSERSANATASEPAGEHTTAAPPSSGTLRSESGPEAAASRSMLADAVSHELRSTLALISGYSQSLLHLQLDDGTQRQYLYRISQAAESLTELADEVLDLAALDKGEVLHRQPVSLAWLVERLAGELAREDGWIVIEPRIPSRLPLVQVDPVWIAHVLRNLISNAALYAGDGSRTLRIEAREEGDRVVMTVRDDGAGFDLDERERVFEAFFRGQRARESGTQGSGLGLYLCRQLIEAHDGRIWLDDVPSGASISFSVPCSRIGEGCAGTPARAGSTPASASGTLTRAGAVLAGPGAPALANGAAGGPHAASTPAPARLWHAPEILPAEDHAADRGVLHPTLGPARPAGATG